MTNSSKLHEILIFLKDLLFKISDESGLDESEAQEIIFRLQRHSLRKLEQNKRFNNEGIAVLSINVIGCTDKSAVRIRV